MRRLATLALVAMLPLHRRGLHRRAPRCAGMAAAADITAAIQNDPDTRVQQREMFWLGQSKDPRATKFFED